MADNNINSEERIIFAFQSFCDLGKYSATSGNFSSEELDEIDILCSEIALACLDCQGSIENQNFSAEESLTWNEISSACKQIAFHAMEIQSEIGSGTWSGETFADHLGWMQQHFSYIGKTVELPEPVVSEFHALVLAPIAKEEKADYSGHALELWQGVSEVERLRKEIKELKEELAALLAEKDHLELVECRELQAEYLLQIGSLTTELYRVETELRELQYTIRLYQAKANRQEKADDAVIREKVQQEYKSYQKKYEDFVSSVKDAEKYKEKTEKQRQKNREWAKKQSEKKSDPSEDPDSVHAKKNSSSNPNPDPKLEENTQRSADEKDEQQEPKSTSDLDPNDPNYIKKLYRKIVKAMHPDTHPNQTEEEKELFKKAVQAYADQDVETLEMVWSLVGSEKTNGSGQDEKLTIEILLREKYRLMQSIRSVKAQIAKIKSSHPYILKPILKDPVKLKEAQDEIRGKIAECHQKIEVCKKTLEEFKHANDGT